jgi:hypothetical protein
VRSRRYWVSAVLLAGLWVSPATAQQPWITYRFGGGFDDAKAATLTNWINDTCRPDDMSQIGGFSFQEAPGKPVSLQVYCRRGETGKLGRVKVVRSEYRRAFPLEMPLSLSASVERAVILGFDLAWIGGMLDPPTGTVVMVVKE